MMAKLEHLGCSKPVVGLVIPTGYSFNLDGTSIYMTMAAIFIAQATNTPLTLGQQLGILARAAADVERRGGGDRRRVHHARGDAVGDPDDPGGRAGAAVGVDRFMSEARAITNLIGNGVATVAVARWEGALDARRMRKILNGETVDEADPPEEVLVADARLAARH